MRAQDLKAVTAEQGQQLLVENNCVACHQRNAAPGIAPQLNDIVAKEPKWASLLPAMKPPSLNSLGDKLHDDALRATIRDAGTTAARRRDWLAIRMPKFRLPNSQLAALVDHMILEDRIPAGADAGEPLGRPDQREDGAPEDLQVSPLQRVAGRRLVTADGFGCTSCHAVGSVKPSRAPIAAVGPDLLMLGQRIRKAWFDRWVRNPARIVPRMEMPSVQTPIRGVLDGHLDQQLDASVGGAQHQRLRATRAEPGADRSSF